jgi:large subunit ribosomal protein L17
MRHCKTKRKFSRTPAHRQALLANLVRALIHFEQIETTQAKAKALKPLADRLIMRAREDTVHARRLVAPLLHNDRDLIHKLFKYIGPLAKEGGGNVRLVNSYPRAGDAAPMAIVEIVNKTSLYDDRRKAEEASRKAKKEEARKRAEESKKAQQAASGQDIGA